MDAFIVHRIARFGYVLMALNIDIAHARGWIEHAYGITGLKAALCREYAIGAPRFASRTRFVARHYANPAR